jgi:hypothetical protein
MGHEWERREKCTRFLWESTKERDHSKDRGVDRSIGSEWILGRLEWAQLDQDRDRWWAVVNFGFWRHGVSPTLVRSLL